MRKFIAIAMAAGAVALGACRDDSRAGREDPRYGALDSECRQFTSCGTCTPVEGCGWCFDSDGSGLCAANPDECPTPAFSWTWNPSGCRVPADVATGREADAGLAATVAEDAAGSVTIDVPTDEDAEAAIDAGTLEAASTPDGDR